MLTRIVGLIAVAVITVRRLPFPIPDRHGCRR